MKLDTITKFRKKKTKLQQLIANQLCLTTGIKKQVDIMLFTFTQ